MCVCTKRLLLEFKTSFVKKTEYFKEPPDKVFSLLISFQSGLVVIHRLFDVLLFLYAAVMEGGTDVPFLLTARRDGGSHVRVCESGSCTRGAGGREQAAVRRAAFPARPQTHHTQLRTRRAPFRLENRSADRER